MTERKRQSGGQRTAAERQRARRQRLADARLAQVTVIVPTGRETEIKAIADSMSRDQSLGVDLIDDPVRGHPDD